MLTKEPKIALRFNSFSSLLKFSGALFAETGDQIKTIDDVTIEIPKRYLDDAKLSRVFKGRQFDLIENVGGLVDAEAKRHVEMSDEEEVDAVNRATDKIRAQYNEYIGIR